MRVLGRALLVALLTAGGTAVIAATPTAAFADCTYYYTSWGRGPNGETTGSGRYPEGATDPEGRVCTHGWWISPRAEDGLDGY